MDLCSVLFLFSSVVVSLLTLRGNIGLFVWCWSDAVRRVFFFRWSDEGSARGEESPAEFQNDSESYESLRTDSGTRSLNRLESPGHYRAHLLHIVIYTLLFNHPLQEPHHTCVRQAENKRWNREGWTVSAAGVVIWFSTSCSIWADIFLPSHCKSSKSFMLLGLMHPCARTTNTACKPQSPHIH